MLLLTEMAMAGALVSLGLPKVMKQEGYVVRIARDMLKKALQTYFKYPEF